MAPILSIAAQLHFNAVTNFALLVLLTSTGWASDQWLRLDGPSVEIWTNTGEGKAKQALHSIQQIRQILLTIYPYAKTSSRTLRLVLFRTETEFGRFRPARSDRAAGFYLPGRQYDYIVMSSQVVPGIEPILFHESLHLFSRDQNLPVPHWFAEGMSELFSNAKVTRSEIRIGEPIQAHVQKLTAADHIDLRTLFTPGNDPAFYSTAFYSKSWALVRLLTLDPEYRSQLPGFLAAISAGSSHAAAFQDAFGKSIAQVAADVRQSLSGNRIAPWVIKAEVRASTEAQPPILQTEPAAQFVIADLLESLQRFDEARDILTRLAKEADNPEIESHLGSISMRQGQPEDAFQHYSKAIELGTRDATIYFERAMIHRDHPAARQQVIDDLRQAVELKPDYTEAYQQLNALSLREQIAPPIQKAANARTNRKGDRQVEGTLVELDCSSIPARFVIKTSQGDLALVVADPSQVVIGNDPGASAELNCGTMPPRAVSVEYAGASKEITAIRFK